MSQDTNKNNSTNKKTKVSFQEPKPEPKPKADAAPKADAKPDAKPEPKPKADAAPKADAKPDAKPTAAPTADVVNGFFQMNTTISKMVFILLILILFVLLFHMGLFLLEYAYGNVRTPYVIYGKINSNEMKVISSNPNMTKSVPIIRSVNESSGIEFTWSVWFYIEDPFGVSVNEHRRIFTKGTYNMGDTVNPAYNIAFLNNSPGLYYNDTHNKLVLVFNTYSNDHNIYETIDVEDIPVEKWVCCVLTMKDRKVNVYINGNMSKEYILLNVPKQNYYDTIVGDDKGFGGYISNLRYYDYAINETMIQSLMSEGPNLKTEAPERVYDTPPWLSMNWYYK
jgi:hypothetical protein